MPNHHRPIDPDPIVPPPAAVALTVPGYRCLDCGWMSATWTGGYCVYDAEAPEAANAGHGVAVLAAMCYAENIGRRGYSRRFCELLRRIAVHTGDVDGLRGRVTR